MAQTALPAITLTDPNNDDQLPSPAQSPIKDSSFADIHTRFATERPETPVSKSSHGRTDSSGWQAVSPARLIRSRSPKAQQTSKEEVNGQSRLSATIDPLSEHILKRTNTPLNLPAPSTNSPRTSNDGVNHKDDTKQSRDSMLASAAPETITRTDTLDSITAAQKELKKGVKAVSFLSRLMGGTKKKETDSVQGDDESSISDGRPEGNDAEVFTQQIDNVEYNPRQPQPPAYIKVRSKCKKERDFDRVFLAQELHCAKRPNIERHNSSNKLRRKSPVNPDNANTIWAMEFSKDGKYLAAAGTDKIVRVWAVLSSSEDRQKHEKQESLESEANGIDPHYKHLSAPVFQSKPVKEYEGHTSTILDLSWSKNNFLLSSSMDKTVRLWHVSRSECLCTFKHNDFVPSISFHPKDDRFFLAGSLDSKLRLWSIPDKSVAFAAQVPDMITAVAFTPDGKHVMAGCLSGLCMFYETEGLKYQTQIHVRSTRGQNAKGSKITGIQAQYGPSGDVKVLITSNDSRVRLYNFRDKSLELKFRGNENNYSQIRATLSDDGRYVVCGSEDRKAYIWSMQQSLSEKRDKVPMEMFEANNSITTVVCMASTKTKQLLSKSEDPVYDICNPPPVTLLSRAERAESQASSRPPTENGSIQHTPADMSFERPKEPASYITRSNHKGGNIIVTADFAGKIKVFRQDCAWQKRLKDESDKSSLFAKRGGRLSRNGSLATRTSQRSLRDTSRNSLSSQAPSDRILSWRQGIASTPSITDGRTDSSMTASRSISPRKSLSKRDTKSGSVKSAHPLAADALVQSPQTETQASAQKHDTPASPAGATRKEADNPLALHGDRSYVFWDQKIWQGHSERIHKMAQQHDLQSSENVSGSSSPGGGGGNDHDHNHLAVRPTLHQTPTYVSKLSDEMSSADEYDDAPEHNDNMQCRNRGSMNFSAKNSKDGVDFVCAECGHDA